jgi:hypothetical protein
MYLAMFLLAGCVTRPVTVETAPKILVSGYNQTTKVPLKVELFLSDELRAAGWQQKGLQASGNYRLVLGDALAFNSEHVAREIFAAVVVTGGSEGPGQAGLRAALIPRFVNVERYGNTLTLLLEWTLQDADGNTVWVDTIKGEGASSWSPWSKSEPASTPMLNDLFHKSFTALSSSRAIREFAAKQQQRSAVRP